MKISEIIIDKYKLRMPPTVYYELLADVREVEEEQEPTDKHFTKADIDAIVKAINAGWELRVNEILDKIRAEIIKYEGDCRLSIDEYPSCKQCTDNVFETIYGILDKYKAETEAE